MGKIWLIIKREYLVRVKKRAFLIMTIVGPLLMATLIILPYYLANENQTVRVIAVQEEKDEYTFSQQLEDTDLLHFSTVPREEALRIKKDFKKSNYYALLSIENEQFTLYSNQQISLSVSNNIQSQLERIIEHEKLKAAGIDLELITDSENTVTIFTKTISKDGNMTDSQTEASVGIGFMCGMLIYMFILIYGLMVMRGVIEEKTNRIVEVIISCVTPFQLMMGKIIGIALVGLTQFLLWILLTLGIGSIAEVALMDTESMADALNQGGKSIIISEISSLTGGVNLLEIFIFFIFYFIGGYLIYSALFAAVGSAVDSESDTQQFKLPFTIPLLLSFILLQPIIEHPDGSLAFWMSMIPLTSPVVMMARLPFGVASWELALSITILILSFIYRTGILMYGKKASYKELWRWLTYKE